MVRHFVADSDLKTLRSKMGAIHQPPHPWGWMRRYGTRYDVALNKADGTRWRFRITRKHISQFALFNYGEVRGIMQPINDYQTAVVMRTDYSAMFMMGVLYVGLVGVGLALGFATGSSDSSTSSPPPSAEMQVLIFVGMAAFMLVIWAATFVYHVYRLNRQLRHIFGDAFATGDQDNLAAAYVDE